MTRRTTFRDTVWQLPLRLAAGGFLLESGISKWDVEEEKAAHLHEFAKAIGVSLLLGGLTRSGRS